MRLSTSFSFALVASATLIGASPMPLNDNYQIERRSNDHLERRMEFWLNKRAEIDNMIVQLSARGKESKKGSKEKPLRDQPLRASFPTPHDAFNNGFKEMPIRKKADKKEPQVEREHYLGIPSSHKARMAKNDPQ
ncbi:hypothetical protein C8J56DRAFT_938996 [Mycena floridula]|nr:hypothetical protein C8J56DRAFT_938996 [Mycena floridula]